MQTNKKGFLLTLDLIIGISIVFIVLAISQFFVSQGSTVTLSEHQMNRVGSDIVNIMDKRNLFDGFDYTKIETEMQKLLPGNYDMLLRLEGNFSEGNGIVEVGGEIPQKRLTISGRRVALTKDDDYVKITYFVWARKQ